MNRSQEYDVYLENLMEISDCLMKISATQNGIDQDERNAVSSIENEYMSLSEELRTAKKTVRDQYRSVLESCTSHAGLRKPNDQRPMRTELNWQDAVRLQEQAASRIRDWITVKSKQAYEARQEKLRQDKQREAALAAAQAEAARKKAAEEERIKKERAEALVEALKNKHRNN